MNDMLCFEFDSATVVDPSHIKYMDQPAGMMDGVKVIQQSEDHRLFLQGQFGGFRIYYLVTHTRVEIVPESVQHISQEHFAATLRLELAQNTLSEHRVTFRIPLVPCRGVRAVRYGLFPDAFQFDCGRPRTESFPCDLSFLLHYAENCPIVPLRVEYIGIAKAEGREAQDRLGEGHEKLQTLLAEQNRRPSRQTTSILLYRPSELVPPILPFADVIETIEAVMIQHFKPRPLNVERLNFPDDSPRLNAKLRAIGACIIQAKVAAPMGASLYSKVVPLARQHVFQVLLN